jgi:hypothetical protein
VPSHERFRQSTQVRRDAAIVLILAALGHAGLCALVVFVVLRSATALLDSSDATLVVTVVSVGATVLVGLKTSGPIVRGAVALLRGSTPTRMSAASGAGVTRTFE